MAIIYRGTIQISPLSSERFYRISFYVQKTICGPGWGSRALGVNLKFGNLGLALLHLYITPLASPAEGFQNQSMVVNCRGVVLHSDTED